MLFRSGQWKRLNVETVEEAMRISEKEHKRLKKHLGQNQTVKVGTKKQKEESLPDWFDKNLENEEMTEEEKRELDQILNSITS